MISTDITGSNANGDASQVFNLLAVVANPDVYAEKVRTLMQATEEHKKFLALVAPANEIVDLREQIGKDREAAKAELEAAKAAAEQIKAEAKAGVATVIADAKKEAGKLIAEAQRRHSDAIEHAARASKFAEEAEAALLAVKAQQVQLEAEIAEAKRQTDAFKKAQDDLAKLRSGLIETHKRHLRELEL